MSEEMPDVSLILGMAMRLSRDWELDQEGTHDKMVLGAEVTFFDPNKPVINKYSEQRLSDAITSGRTVIRVIETHNVKNPWIFLPEAPHDDRRTS